MTANLKKKGVVALTYLTFVIQITEKKLISQICKWSNMLVRKRIIIQQKNVKK